MRRNMLFDLCRTSIFLDDIPDRHARKPCATLLIEKYCIRCLAFLYENGAYVIQIAVEKFYRNLSDRHKALFFSFAKKANKTVFQKKLRESNSSEFGNSGTRRIQKFEDGAVANPFFCCKIGFR